MKNPVNSVKGLALVTWKILSPLIFLWKYILLFFQNVMCRWWQVTHLKLASFFASELCTLEDSSLRILYKVPLLSKNLLNIHICKVFFFTFYVITSDFFSPSWILLVFQQVFQWFVDSSRAHFRWARVWISLTLLWTVKKYSLILGASTGFSSLLQQWMMNKRKCS